MRANSFLICITYTPLTLIHNMISIIWKGSSQSKGLLTKRIGGNCLVGLLLDF
jgi:hypothetical protein